MTTFESIIASLTKLNAPKNRPVIVHTSLKKIGKTDGGAKTLLDALMEYFTKEGGILCIPTHTWGFLDREITLDLTLPETNIGVLPTLAASDPRGVRTMHPTHSMAVFGEKSKVAEFVSGEEKVDTMTSPKGCYSKIINRDGYVLLIGVGQDKNTTLHCVEEMLGVKNRNSDKLTETKIKHADGSVESRMIYPMYAEGIPDVSLQFPNYEPAFRYHGCITDGTIGSAKAQLCSAKRMAQVMTTIYNRSHGAELLKELKPIEEKYYI